MRTYPILASIFLALLAQPAAGARGVDLSFRQLDNVTHFSGVEQSAIEARLPSGQQLLGVPVDWIASAGAIRDRSQAFSFVSIGGGATFGLSPAVAVVGSFSPTWLEADRLNGRDFGGHFHFTTVVGLRSYLDRRQRIALALRVQHTSNGGLNESNPGLDLAGIELIWRFDDRGFDAR